MDFDLDDTQRELRDTARRFLEREAPTTYARAMMDDERGYTDEVWKRMADLGWMALPFPEEHGGLDLGFVALALVVTEMGRVVLPGPFLSTMIGGLAIAEAGSDEQRARLLPSIVAGEARATLAHLGDVEERGGRLHGERRFVLDGHIAEHVVVVAHSADDEPGLFLAEPSARIGAPTMDETRKTAHLSFAGTDAEPLAKGGREVLHRAYDRACVLLAAEMLGCAERSTELAVDYAKEREQFGRPIGSFQAVKHRAADMHVEVESLRNAVYYAAWAIERDHPDAALAASMAKAYASDAARRVTQSCIQIHGGIGFTWEHDAHLYFKRVKLDEVAFGDATFHRDRVARLLEQRA